MQAENLTRLAAVVVCYELPLKKRREPSLWGVEVTRLTVKTNIEWQCRANPITRKVYRLTVMSVAV